MSARAPHEAVVLLVEDKEDDVLLTQEAFARAKIPNPLRVVNSGDEAIAYLQGRDEFADRAQFPVPDLVLLDINMPGGDGFTVLRWVRAHAGLKALRIVMLTTSDESSDIDSAYLLGANSYLVKPLDFDSYVRQMALAIGFWFENSKVPRLNRDRSGSNLLPE